MSHHIALLTAGRDRPYALGLATSLVAEGLGLDFIGSDELESAELRRCATVRILNLRGATSPDAGSLRKAERLARYYVRLLLYAVSSEASLFHVLWNNRLEYLDRTLILTFYKLLGKRVLFTAHNVNIRKRDGCDTRLNRLTLRYQYWIVDHIFVHTHLMADELRAEFGVPVGKISVIPFGINDSVPHSSISRTEARERLGFTPSEKALLFYGNIAKYKGVDLLVEAMPEVLRRVPDARLVIAGRPKGEESYWGGIEERIRDLGIESRVTRRIEFIPDEDTEVYFKAADALVLPYRFVFQSGVLFLGYSFGLPVIAADVGALKEEVLEGKSGFVCDPNDPHALAEAIARFFSSDLYHDLPARRAWIRTYASERYSWTRVASITHGIYKQLLGEKRPPPTGVAP